jgi:hypothetical protein
MNADTGDGVWCPTHRKRHGYKTLELRYGEKKADGKFKLLWCCKETHEVLEEM